MQMRLDNLRRTTVNVVFFLSKSSQKVAQLSSGFWPVAFGIMKILLIFLLVALVSEVYTSNQRIVGGSEVAFDSIPFQVALLPRSNLSTVPLLCGGSLINLSTVLTAAHCLRNTEKTFVIIGAHNLTDVAGNVYRGWVNASNYRIHPQFNHQYAHKDIALVLLNNLVKFTERIQPVELPRHDESFADEIGTVSGYGNYCDICEASIVLKMTHNKILHDEECSKLLGTIAVPSSSQLCTSTVENKSGICRGDSGELRRIIKTCFSDFEGRNLFCAIKEFSERPLRVNVIAENTQNNFLSDFNSPSF